MFRQDSISNHFPFSDRGHTLTKTPFLQCKKTSYVNHSGHERTYYIMHSISITGTWKVKPFLHLENKDIHYRYAWESFHYHCANSLRYTEPWIHFIFICLPPYPQTPEITTIWAHHDKFVTTPIYYKIKGNQILKKKGKLCEEPPWFYCISF